MRKRVNCLALGLLIIIAGGASATLAAPSGDRDLRMTGEIVTLNLEAGEILLRNEVGSSTEEVRFVVADDAVIRVHGLKGKLDRLKTGDIITVKYLRKDGKNVVSEIQHM